MGKLFAIWFVSLFTASIPNVIQNLALDKEAPQNHCLEDQTIADRQGMSENDDFVEKPTPSQHQVLNDVGYMAFSLENEWSGSYHASLRGKLVRKNFSAPQIVANPPFGWFIELDDPSRKIIADLFDGLTETEKALYYDLDLGSIRLLAGQFAIRKWARDHVDSQVMVEGEILSPDLLGKELHAFNFSPEIVTPEITEQEKVFANQYLYRESVKNWESFQEAPQVSLPARAVVFIDTPQVWEEKIGGKSTPNETDSSPTSGIDEHPWEMSSFNWDKENDDSLALSDDQPEQLVTMSGKLHLEVLNHDFELGEIENGGYPIYCWMVKLDSESFEIACSTPVRACFQTPASIRAKKNGDELWLTGEYDLKWLCENAGQTVSVQGYLRHAHTAHHHTPVMLDTAPWFQ
jgi:hypothetical protein